MRFKKGCTRWVILTATEAFKIALPFRPFVPIRIVFDSFLKGELRGKLKKHNGSLIRTALRFATIAGIEANRREMRITREHPEYPIAPVLRSYLWGFVIVMARGEPIEELPKSWGDKFSLPDYLHETDLFYLSNICRVGGELRLIDYGDPSADLVLPMLFGGRNQAVIA